MRLSIATKISLAFSMMVIVFTIVIMASIWRTQQLFGQIQALNQSIIPLSLILSDAQNDLKSFDVALSESEPENLRRALQLTRMMARVPQRVFTKLRKASELSDNEPLTRMAEPERLRLQDIQRKLTRIVETAATLDADTHHLQTLLQQRQQSADKLALDDAIQVQRGALRKKTQKLDLELTRVRNDLRISTDLALVRANESERTNLYALGVMSAIALLVTLTMFAVALLIVRPLGALTEGVKQIARGEYHTLENRAHGRLGRDEIATLTEEFNSMARALDARDAALREQHDALLKAERLATIGRMTSLITHELRNPLSSIGLNAEMIIAQLHELEGEEREDALAGLETIIAEVDRLRDITEEYLVYARLPEPKLARHDLSELLEQIIDFHEWEWGQEGVEVELTLPDQPVILDADANQLRQALLNLIKNAVEASSNAEDALVEVTLTRDLDENTARVSVKDHGEGIPDDIQGRIFEPFFTSKVKGTGLGLAMTQQIVVEHHGEVSHQSNPERGTTFQITLPLPDISTSNSEEPT